MSSSGNEPEKNEPEQIAATATESSLDVTTPATPTDEAAEPEEETNAAQEAAEPEEETNAAQEAAEPKEETNAAQEAAAAAMGFAKDATEQLQSIFCSGGFVNPFASPKGPPKPVGILEDGILRNAALADGLLEHTTAGASVATLYDTFHFGVQRNPQAACLGHRPTATSESYEWATYEAVRDRAARVGCFLKSVGLSPGDRVGLSGKNAPEYLTAVQGCFWAGATTVPIYDTFGEAECQYIAKQAEVRVVFVSRDNLDTMMDWTKNIPSVEKIVVWGSTGGEELPSSGNRVLSFEQCLEMGDEAQPCMPSPPKPEDLAIVMYTSGTTGMPKGVMLPHSALVAAIAGMERYFQVIGGPIVADDVFMSYLPLAHVFDFYCECFFLFRGAKVGYYRGNQKTLVDDIGVLKPTIFVGVPRVFDRIYKKVNGMLEEGSVAKKLLFDFFFDKKLEALRNGAGSKDASYIGDALVFSKIKAKLGGRVRFLCSGGAPLPQHIEEWLKVTMCCPVVQGYGLTETCAASCVSMPDRMDQTGTVGPPLFATETRLDPVPDMGYDGTPSGGGEICFRGPSLFSGYYQKPDATALVLAEDGWFHTGDIGRITPEGCVSIIDRKKQLFKLSQGEYVSPEKVEGVCAKSRLVGQVFIHGSSTEASLVAVVVPSEALLEEHGGKEQAEFSESLKKRILEDLADVCRAESLKGYEIPKAVIVHGSEFTPESGFVTPSFKLKRPTLWKHFSRRIEEAYDALRG